MKGLLLTAALALGNPGARKSSVSSSFLREKMNRHRITRDTGLREKMD